MSCTLIYVLSLLCPCRIVPRCIYFVYYALVECCVYKYLALCLLACMSLCSFQVWMSIVITTLCNYLVDQALIWIFTSSLLDHFKLVSYAFPVFLHTMIIVYCFVSGVSCSYDSSASQLLELSVSEFCSTVPNSHVKSRVCFRVLSRNSQRGRL